MTLFGLPGVGDYDFGSLTAKFECPVVHMMVAILNSEHTVVMDQLQ